MATWDGISGSIIANRFGNVYVKDYMDISGRLFVRRDASLNSRLFVMNDASFMGNLHVDEYLTMNQRFIVNEDASLNGRLMVLNDVSFNRNLAITQVSSNFTLATGSPTILLLSGDSITRQNVGGGQGVGYNAYVNQRFSGNYFLKARIVNISDVNFGGKWIGFSTAISSNTPYFGFKFGGPSSTAVSVYFNNSIQSYRSTYVVNDIFSIEIRTNSVSYYKNNNLLTRYYNPNNVLLYPWFRMEYRATSDSITSISIGTLSNSIPTYTINGNLTSNVHLRVNGDVSLNSNVIVGRDLSCNGNIVLGRNLTVGGNLAVKNYTTANIINTTTTNYRLVIAKDLSLNGRLAVSSDTSLNGNLFVAEDLSYNGNLVVGGTMNVLRDISVNGITIGTGSGGYTNTIVGNLALANNSVGINNTAVGYAALQLNTASNNTAIGFNALVSNTTGTNNTAAGYNALGSNTTGSNNTAIGYNAGSANVDGSFNTYIGYNANADAGNYSYSTAIGANALITGSNQIVLGTSAETVVIGGKIRHPFIPNILFGGSNGQSIESASTATVLFPAFVYDGSYCGIGYSSATGIFTNNNPYTIGVTVSPSISVASPGIAGLMVSIVSSVYGVVASSGISGTTVSQAVTNCCATFPMANNDSFYVTVRNTKASAITINYSEAGTGARLMLRVF